jgi:hypothetical protein
MHLAIGFPTRAVASKGASPGAPGKRYALGLDAFLAEVAHQRRSET